MSKIDLKSFSRLPILFAAFIDLFGVGIIIPVLPVLFFGSNSLFFEQFTDFQKTFFLGILVALYPLAQFFGAPILGVISDKRGRRPVLLFSLFGTFLGYVLFSVGILTGHVWLLFAGRILDGFTGGNISTIYSAIADISDEKSKPKNFGLIGMAFGLGIVLGPFFGGKLSDPTVSSMFNTDTPFWFGAALALINFWMVYFMFPETLKTSVAHKLDFLIGFKNIQRAFKMENLKIMFLVSFLLSFGFNLFVQFFSVYLARRFHMNQSQIGDMFAYVGIWVAISQGFITPMVAKKYSPTKVLPVALILMSFTLASIIFIRDYRGLFFFLPLIALFQGLIVPNYTTILSNLSGDDSQGEVMGISQSLTALSQTFPPIIDGLVIGLNVNAPIMLASMVMFSAFGVYTLKFSDQRKATFHEI